VNWWRLSTVETLSIHSFENNNFFLLFLWSNNCSSLDRLYLLICVANNERNIVLFKSNSVLDKSYLSTKVIKTIYLRLVCSEKLDTLGFISNMSSSSSSLFSIRRLFKLELWLRICGVSSETLLIELQNKDNYPFYVL
jgi:hypothetical protein